VLPSGQVSVSLPFSAWKHEIAVGEGKPETPEPPEQAEIRRKIN